MNSINSIEIIDKGMKCLLENLGVMEMEQFISAIMRERFDYTKWRREYFDEISLEELLSEAAAYEKEHPFRQK